MAPDGGDSHISIPVGIVVGLLASFVQSLGLTIQRKSHVQNQALPEEERKVEHRRPLWLLGFGIFISSNLFGSIFQIASLPVVILAPLGAVSLLWNAFFARLILGDVFSPWMVLSTLCIAGGAVLIAVFGIVPEPTHSLEDLLELFNRPAFIVYFSLLGLFTFVSLAITHAVEYATARRIALPADTPPLSPLLAPTTDPTILTGAAIPSDSDHEDVTERTPLIDPKTSRSSSLSSPSSISSLLTTSSRTPLLLAMSYGSFGGIISGMCLLFAKSGVELLVLTIGGDNQFWRWQSWVLVLGLGVCALLQLWYMHKSLVLADPTLVCPLAFCFYNLSSIINGLVYFNQFSLLSTSHLLLVILGIFILLAGVWIVSFPPSGSHGIDVGTWDEELSDDEEIHEDEPLPMAASVYAPDEEIGMGRIAHSREPSVVGRGVLHLDTGARAPETESSPPSARGRGPRIRRQTDSALLSSQYGTAPSLPPSSIRRRTPQPSGHGTVGPTSPRPGHASYPHPLSPSGPSGFSIGLSPVSPGFALRPSRRRRVTSITSVDGIRDSVSGLSVKDTRRRIVSDGSLGSLGGELMRANPDVEAQPEVPGEEERPRGAKARWRWLGGIFRAGRK